jgi:ribonuclease T1
MSNPNSKRKPRENRPTDPFGGPTKQGSTISFGIVLVAFAIFLLVQWTNGNLDNLLGGAAVLSTVTAPVDAPTPTLQAATTDETPVAQATATRRPTKTPAATASARARNTPTARATVQPTPTANAPPITRASDLPTIAFGELPPEAQETIALIDQGGPFPYDRDGIIFQNRERILPRQPEGYYHEYTVITPGSNDRGARRNITGGAGEMY